MTNKTIIDINTRDSLVLYIDVRLLREKELISKQTESCHVSGKIVHNISFNNFLLVKLQND